MWALQALKDEYDVSLITTGAVDLEALNQFYGTSLRPDDLKIRSAQLPFFVRFINGGDALRGAYYQRFCKEIATEFDALISSYNLLDFGVPAIHCIADFCWDEGIRKGLHPPPSGMRGLFHRDSPYRSAYTKVVRSILNPSGRNLFGGDDLILANSKWTACVIAEKYKKEVPVLYPPVVDDFPAVSSTDRENGFVCVGRIAPEKRIESIIDILRLVRGRGHDIHLHIIGSAGDPSYGRTIDEICRNERDWIEFEGLRVGVEKKVLLSQHRFGIHACHGEAFGIGVAEMVKAGCVTFVPDSGGQVEIVNHPSLVYVSIDDAVEKIAAVLRNGKKQMELADHLLEQAKLFSAENFMKQIRVVVDDFLRFKSTSLSD